MAAKGTGRPCDDLFDDLPDDWEANLNDADFDIDETYEVLSPDHIHTVEEVDQA